MKKEVIKLILILCVSLMPQCGFAQYFKAASVIPQNPTISDSISLIDTFSAPDSGLELQSQIYSRSGFEITIINCYADVGGFTIPVYKQDTTTIGYLPAGVYSCTFYSRKDARTSANDPYVPCDSMPNRDTLYYTFTVSNFHTAISDLTLTILILSPNPATTTLYSSTSLQDLDLSITDITGRICAAPHTDRDIRYLLPARRCLLPAATDARGE